MTPDDRALAVGRALLALVNALGIPAAPAPDPIVTADNAADLFPGLTSRCFADAARRGAFPARKQGRKLVARASDVEAWLQSRRFRPRVRRQGPSADPAVAYACLASPERRGRGGR
jgi:hypothetical protein